MPNAWLTSRVAAAACGLVLLGSAARAEMVRLTNGRVITVEHCVLEGETAVLALRGGGEVRVPRALIAERLPDEVPLERVFATEALAASPYAVVPPPGRATIRSLVDRVAERVGIDRKLAHAVVQTESNYHPLAVSPKGAMGLMQIMPVIAREYALADPFDPERNLEVGLRHLRRLLRRFDVRRAVAAYNAGETVVHRYGGVPPYRETQDYVRRVMTALQ